MSLFSFAIYILFLLFYPHVFEILSYPINFLSKSFYSNFYVSVTSLVAQTVKHLPTMRETWIRSLGQEDSLEKGKAPHSSTLAWKIPWMEEPGRLQSVGSQRVGHDWATSPYLICLWNVKLFLDNLISILVFFTGILCVNSTLPHLPSLSIWCLF